VAVEEDALPLYAGGARGPEGCEDDGVDGGVAVGEEAGLGAEVAEDGAEEGGALDAVDLAGRVGGDGLEGDKGAELVDEVLCDC
jgi:hypothetical protein